MVITGYDRVPNVEEFEPVKAFMNFNANITWAQLINERPNVRKQLRVEKTQATRCNVIINGKAIRALVDTGAGPSTIMNKLRKELNIPIIKKSNVILTIADGKSIASLGIAEIDIEIDDELGLTLEVEVIDSKRKDLILGTDILKHGIIDMKEQLLVVELDGEIYEIPIDYEKKKEYKDIFEYNGEKLGRTDKIKYKIEIEENKEPIAQKRYKVTEDKTKYIKKEIEQLSNMGKIRKSWSAWASPVKL
ncbi:ribonuclease H-like domain-containing protein [Rhizophagus irregularis DAOM 181602=DAOM 197198]|nr:ribonuclease H-like domain-containing protein [Rhizophagus irregularis DAOM 181602=DAOM 197198]